MAKPTEADIRNTKELEKVHLKILEEAMLYESAEDATKREEVLDCLHSSPHLFSWPLFSQFSISIDWSLQWSLCSTFRFCQVFSSYTSRQDFQRTHRKHGGCIIWSLRHRMVSSVRESRSDDKKISIFTGTKRLPLKADTREDRVAWMEVLQAVKEMFSRLSNCELLAPVDDITLSTAKLSQRLLEEGVNEAAIKDNELIMRNEFAALQNQLLALKQKHWLLIDTLRQLEVQCKARGV